MTVTRYAPSRTYMSLACVTLALAILCAYCGVQWVPAFLPAGLLLLVAMGVFFLALQPHVEVHEEYLAIGRQIIPWGDIRRLDRTSWFQPLLVHLTVTGGRRILLIYPGDFDSANALLRHLRRYSREALIDGVPYRQFWGETLTGAGDRRQPTPVPRYHLLRPEDEAEVERLYQRLKTVGHFDPKQSDEK